MRCQTYVPWAPRGRIPAPNRRGWLGSEGQQLLERLTIATPMRFEDTAVGRAKHVAEDELGNSIRWPVTMSPTTTAR
jgi:hypothetical protein